MFHVKRAAIDPLTNRRCEIARRWHSAPTACIHGVQCGALPSEVFHVKQRPGLLLETRKVRPGPVHHR